MMETSPSVSLRVKRKNVHQTRRSLCLNRISDTKAASTDDSCNMMKTSSSVSLQVKRKNVRQTRRPLCLNRISDTKAASTDDSCNMMETSLSVSLRVKRKNVRQTRRPLCLNRISGQDMDGSLWMVQSRQRDQSYTKMPTTTVIQRQEMTSYLRLFDDDLIQDFLRMDCCYKMTDKYLLAMTFVYFKRAHFTVAEYTKKNFFIALYLANTMEEEEEEIKYEIFPWALGKNWRRMFPHFLKQRDELWARIQYRAAVSRRCCEEVMAIVSLHFVWQRQRSDHHSGAQRQYSEQGPACFPRGPFASPVSCSLCNFGSRLHHTTSFSDAPPQAVDSTYPHLFTSALVLEVTPVKIPASHRNTVKDTSEQKKPCCCCPEEVPRESSFCVSPIDDFLDWLNEM